MHAPCKDSEQFQLTGTTWKGRLGVVKWLKFSRETIHRFLWFVLSFFFNMDNKFTFKILGKPLGQIYLEAIYLLQYKFNCDINQDSTIFSSSES